MNIFDFKDYRIFLNTLCKDRQAKRGTKAIFAKAANCQASYFSQVLKGKVHITEDQAHGISKYLKMSHFETEYFILLLRFAKAGTTQLRDYLIETIEDSQLKFKKIGQNVTPEHMHLNDIDVGKYFSSWIPSAIHLLTSSKLNSAELIANRLGIDIKITYETLLFLEKIGYVEKNKEKWIYKGSSLHVPKDSLWQNVLQTSRQQLVQRSMINNPEDAIHFSSVFTIDKSDFEELKNIMSSAIKKSHLKIQKSGSEELYCLCVNLFSVV